MYFRGTLVRDKELVSVAAKRKKKEILKSVPIGERDSYLADGWLVKSESKYRITVFKPKESDELFEDQVWRLFSNMGFEELNADRHFEIWAGEDYQQVDVFASDGNHAFVVECRSSKKKTVITKKEISAIADLKKEMTLSIKKHYQKKSLRVSFLLATQGRRWTEARETMARKRQILVCQDRDLDYYTQLSEHLGSSAKFQFYSLMFRDKRISELGRIRVPAIFAGKGKAKYYNFVIQPEQLLKIAFVHHRRDAPAELLGSYQRMMKRTRLNQVTEFISAGGYFPNNVVINFTKKPQFDKKSKVGDIVYGILGFPPYYASAWVIDGQHRLYGYSGSPRKSTDTLPVLAFDRLDVQDQARLFVEINREQKAVGPSLLWDLYSDIYEDSDNRRQQQQRAISLVVKRLNAEHDSKLHGSIMIPSAPSAVTSNQVNLTMASFCDGLQDSGLMEGTQGKEGLLFREDFDNTIDFATARLKVFFRAVAEMFSEDWDAGDQGVLRTNIGIRILIIILSQLLLYLKYVGDANIYKKADLTMFSQRSKLILEPMITRLRKMSKDQRGEIRKSSSKGWVVFHAQQFAWTIRKKFEGFGLELLKTWKEPPPNDIRSLIEDTEKGLRVFLISKLSGIYGDSWWKEGIPRGVVVKVRETIDKRAKKIPAWQEVNLQDMPPERRMNYLLTPHLREIVEFKKNWDKLKTYFISDKDYTMAQFKSFEVIRDPYVHNAEEELDEIQKSLGYWGIKWLRGCIGLKQVSLE